MIIPCLLNYGFKTVLCSFFSNTGAVAGVFVLVGLAAASILLWIFFAVRRRNRTRRLEHDTAVSATLAAAGFNRAPLDDGDDDDIDPRASGSNVHGYSTVGGMPQRSSSGLAMSSVPSAAASVGNARMSHLYAETTPFRDDPSFGGEVPFNPYTDHVYIPGNPNGVQQPPPSAFHMGSFRDRTSSAATGATGAAAAAVVVGGDRDRRVSNGTAGSAYDGTPMSGHQHHHSASYNSAGSNEPLLSGYQRDHRRSTSGPHNSGPPPYTSGSSSATTPSGHLPTPANGSQILGPQVGTKSARSSVYSTASADQMVMTGIAISTDDFEASADRDPFAANYVPPPSNHGHSSGSSSGHGHHDDRLDARMMDWVGDGDSARDLKDEEDYSRKVLPHGSSLSPLAGAGGSMKKGGKTLGVRNMTENDLA